MVSGTGALGSIEYEVSLTLQHMPSTENRITELLIMSPTPHPLIHVLPPIHPLYDNLWN